MVFRSSAARCWPAPLPLPSSRHIAFLPSTSTFCPSSSHGCLWLVTPLRIRGGLRLVPSRLIAPGVAAVRTWEAAAGKPESTGGISRTLQLRAMILVWNHLNIYFNIFNKLVRRVVPFLRAGSESNALPMYHHHLPLRIQILLHHTHVAAESASQAEASLKQAKLLPLGFIHMLGNVFTNMSLGMVSVSFAHTVRAMEPFFSVLFLGQTPSLLVLGSLIPIVGGVVLASMTEVTFNWIGFWSAMASNPTNQLRNVYSKKILAYKEDSLDDINLFSIITIMAFLFSAPRMLSVEGIKFSPSYLHNAGVNLKELSARAALAGTCFYFYQQISYSLLARISPVTHSVANSLKRVVVIVSSVVFFRIPISPINALGTGAALGGVFLYSQFKKLKPETKAA